MALLVVTLLAAVAASCVAGLVGLSRQNAALEEVVHTDMRRVLVVTNIRRLFRSMGVTERDLLLEKSGAQAAKLRTSMAKTRAELYAQLEEYESVMPASEATALGDLRGAYVRWVALDESVLAALETRKNAEAVALAQSHASDPVSWEKVIAGLVTANEQRLRDQVAVTASMHRAARLVIIGGSGLAAFVAITLGTVLFLGIRRAMADIVRLNTNLEGQVADRTRALASRERSMQLVLDSMGEGLVSVGRDGHVLPERSRAVVAWLGEPSPAATIEAYLYPDESDRAARETFAGAFGQLCEDVLPFTLTAAQMPARLVRGDLHLELEYRQVFENDVFTRVLVIARDISARIASERSEREAREQHAILACLLRDRTGFEQFVRESERLLAELAIETSDSDLKRKLHTLKGNAGIFGFRSVADRCQALEEVLYHRGGLLDEREVVDLVGLWRQRIDALADLLTDAGRHVVQVKSSEYELLLAHIRARRDHDALLAQVKSWRCQRTLDRLQVLRAQAERLASKLDKGVTVEVEDNDLHVPPGRFDGFWAELVHVIRNAVDHGIEPSEVRVGAGKAPGGTIRLATRMGPDRQLIVSVSDDGAGIDVAALVAAARVHGLEAADPTELMFADGVSTKEVATAISGRGVGMGAVRAASSRLGGKISVESEPGRGTTFTFVLPLPAAPPPSVELGPAA